MELWHAELGTHKEGRLSGAVPQLELVMQLVLNPDKQQDADVQGSYARASVQSCANVISSMMTLQLT